MDAVLGKLIEYFEDWTTVRFFAVSIAVNTTLVSSVLRTTAQNVARVYLL